MKKEHWKIAAAAVFLTGAGFCFYVFGGRDEAVPFQTISLETISPENHQTAWDAETDIGLDPSQEESRTEKNVSCFVHICGEVVSPGVYELTEDSRIFEAVEAAGGFTEEAAREAVNLAALVSDGMQIVILSSEEYQALREQGLAGPAAGAAGLSGAGDAGTGGFPVNLNTATKEQLMTLKGIGESRAEDIIRYRTEHGSFQKIEDIMKIPGIKDAAFQKIKDSITV